MNSGKKEKSHLDFYIEFYKLIAMLTDQERCRLHYAGLQAPEEMGHDCDADDNEGDDNQLNSLEEESEILESSVRNNVEQNLDLDDPISQVN